MSEPDNIADEALMVAYQQGDDTAFTVLYRRHSAKVYGFLLARLREKPQADDVFQSTFLKLHQSRFQYDPAFRFLPWLFTICRNSMLDSIRKTQSVREESNPQALEEAMAEEVDVPASLPDLLSLSAGQRQAVELRYSQELSFAEIAKKLDTSPTNVRQLISRAVKKLRLAK